MLIFFNLLSASLFLLVYLLVGIIVFTVSDYFENLARENILDSDLSIATIVVCWPGWIILKAVTGPYPLVINFGKLVRNISFSLRK